MSEERREKIENIKEQLESLKAEIETIETEEQEYFDNMPESLQGGEKGQNAEIAIDALAGAVGYIDDAISNLEEAMQ